MYIDIYLYTHIYICIDKKYSIYTYIYTKNKDKILACINALDPICNRLKQDMFRRSYKLPVVHVSFLKLNLHNILRDIYLSACVIQLKLSQPEPKNSTSQTWLKLL